MTRSSHLLISFIAAFYVASLTYFITTSSATLVFALFILFFGLLLSSLITNKQQRLSALTIFNIIYCTYVLLALNHFLSFQLDWSNFTQDWRDEYKFYLMTQENQFETIGKIFNDTLVDRVYIEYGLYVFYISSIASLANTFFDGNHLLLQLLGTALFGISTSVIVFKILCLYINEKKAYKYTLLFMLLSLFSTYSVQLLRDTAIAFFYAIGIYLVLSPIGKNKIYKLLLLILINWIVWELRFENGLIFSAFTIYYYYKAYGKSYLGFITGSLASLFILVVSSQYLYEAFYTIERYSALTLEVSGEKEDSLGSTIYNLPPGIQQVVAIANSQIQPFPPWNIIDTHSNIFIILEGIFQTARSLFWFVVIISIVKWLVLDKKTSSIKGIDLKFLSILCLVFFLASTANITLRRIMAFYPYIFLIYTIIRTTSVSPNQAKKLSLFSIFLYFILILLYYIFKL